MADNEGTMSVNHEQDSDSKAGKCEIHSQPPEILGRGRYSVNDLVTETADKSSYAGHTGGHHTLTRCTDNYERSELRCEEVTSQ